MTKSLNCESCAAPLPNHETYSKCVYCGCNNMVQNGTFEASIAPRYVSFHDRELELIRLRAYPALLSAPRVGIKTIETAVEEKVTKKPAPSFLYLLWSVTPIFVFIKFIYALKNRK